MIRMPRSIEVTDMMAIEVHVEVISDVPFDATMELLKRLVSFSIASSHADKLGQSVAWVASNSRRLWEPSSFSTNSSMLMISSCSRLSLLVWFTRKGVIRETRGTYKLEITCCCTHGVKPRNLIRSCLVYKKKLLFSSAYKLIYYFCWCSCPFSVSLLATDPSLQEKVLIWSLLKTQPLQPAATTLSLSSSYSYCYCPCCLLVFVCGLKSESCGAMPVWNSNGIRVCFLVSCFCKHNRSSYTTFLSLGSSFEI